MKAFNPQPNLSDRERMLRLILGVYGLPLGFLFIQGWAGFLIGCIGLFLIFTAWTGWCPLYTRRPNRTSQKDSEPKLPPE